MIRHISFFLILSLFTITAHANRWQIAVNGNDVDALSALLIEDAALTHKYGPHMWLHATLLEHTKVLAWLLENKIPGDSDLFGEHKMSLWRMAFAHHKLETAQWMVNNKLVGMIDKDGVGPWGLAAGFGFIAMLEWLKASTIPMEDPAMIWRSAFANGQVEALQWLFDNHVDIPLHADGRNLWLFAATFDHTNTLEWALRVNLPGRDAVDRDGLNMWLLAAALGNLNVLKWLYKNDPEGFAQFKAQIYDLALANERVNVTGWIDEMAGTHDAVKALISSLVVRGSF